MIQDRQILLALVADRKSFADKECEYGASGNELRARMLSAGSAIDREEPSEAHLDAEVVQSVR